MTVVTRFAPSPTGFLHIGGARTALFNWLFAKHRGGKFYLRIEDTDTKRSSPEFTEDIIESMKWMGIMPEDDAVFYQSKNVELHRKTAEDMVRQGKAYYCYCSAQELAEERKLAAANNMRYKYSGCCRYGKKGPVADMNPVIRARMPTEGSVIFDDKTRGWINFNYTEIDDIIIMRSDGTPTYLYAVVVDDYNMKVDYVIRGDDHLTNTATQVALYNLLNWRLPAFVHIPLIHGPDGQKLSKRHGAVSVNEYRKYGILPEAMNNYLLLLGWSHGNDVMITEKQAIEWFNLDSLGKSPARFDFDKLCGINKFYMGRLSDSRLINLLINEYNVDLNDDKLCFLRDSMQCIRERAYTLLDFKNCAAFCINDRPFVPTSEARKRVADFYLETLKYIVDSFRQLKHWHSLYIDELIVSLAKDNKKMKQKIMHTLRVALTGTMKSPGLIDVMVGLGKDECIARIDDAIIAEEKSAF